MIELHDIIKALKALAKELDKTPTIIEFQAKHNLSKRQINKHGWANLCKMAGLEPNKSSQQRQATVIESRPPKILIFDIETAPIKAFVYGIWQQNVNLKYIEKDWFVFSFAAKWLDSDEIFYHDVSKEKNVENEKKVCKKIHKLLNEADIIVGHNSDKFDLKKLNTRFIKHNLSPIAKKQTIDTLKIARRYFSFTSNKLDFIAKFLGIEGKYKSKKFDQSELWMACYNQDQEAWKENKIYNEQDILVTEQVFNKLKTYDHSLNFQAYIQTIICVCGCKEFYKDGTAYTKTGIFQRYRCTDCHKTFTDKTNLLDKDQKRFLQFK